MIRDYTPTIRQHQRTGVALIALVAVGLGGWGTLAKLAGAVIAPAVVVVEGNTKKVQHLDGGIVAYVGAKNGDPVKAGDVLLRLDPTETEASLAIMNSQLVELKAHHARLLCERDGCPAMTMPTGEEFGSAHARSVFAGQAKLMQARAEVRDSKKAQLTERIGQLDQSIEGLKAQRASGDDQVALMARELAALHHLDENKLVGLSRLLALERDAARLRGEGGRLNAEVARTRIQVGETRLQLLEVDHTALSEVLTDLRDVEGKIAEAEEKAQALRARLLRMAITAPSEGIVHNLTATTVGGVVHAGDVIAEVVPQDETLVLEARVEPAMIDRVKINQASVARMTAFNSRTTPELKGHVTSISADAKQDSRTGASYFAIRVALEPGELTKLHGESLKPGMPAEVHVSTGDRTALSYLLKPATDQFSHAMKER